MSKRHTPQSPLAVRRPSQRSGPIPTPTVPGGGDPLGLQRAPSSLFKNTRRDVLQQVRTASDTPHLVLGKTLVRVGQAGW
jgi:hypothetical protein